MGAVSELVPFAREILSQKPNRKMVKIYAVGTALALIGAVLGLLETVCSPFTPAAKDREWSPRSARRHGARWEERPAAKGTEESSPMRRRKHAS
ncbi:G0/G1 switch protein 2 [Amblyraja radiata]|uniref:G0/G1 switch protein 2 n=1 Tax=Amblyraja radiata TaxID=386614 RepID=UPI0014027FE2|nr:G0/G1 switch protein 2 [Amblyraja radiata]XP_032898870.1 G0/G1 switch protein 2 [Amblyraja radiata]